MCPQSPERDPFKNPFAPGDADRHVIWDMLVTRDIGAFLRADWNAIHGDFLEANFTGFSAHFQSDPQAYSLAFPTLQAYCDEWLRQARQFGAARDAGDYAGDPRSAIFAATRLEEIDIDGDAALVRKKFDGELAGADGSAERMNWQTLYVCRRDQARWKIAGFIGYLPYEVADAA
ncbi:hypothetical protein CUV01_15450 [Paracoccus tegillarcae]|uniref:SnoaL-like domain-containing protein n=2 Tax=Paracoccus tegillarcae TaxID=1529068 RepID=A0A2K9EHZ4_9RHOB|nr:hypothetical protein CUV01_15450 [Paracoccus tegillarcae]